MLIVIAFVLDETSMLDKLTAIPPKAGRNFLGWLSRGAVATSSDWLSVGRAGLSLGS